MTRYRQTGLAKKRQNGAEIEMVISFDCRKQNPIKTKRPMGQKKHTGEMGAVKKTRSGVSNVASKKNSWAHFGRKTAGD